MKKKIMGIIGAIAIIVIIIMAMIFSNQHSNAISVNEFFDDLIDRNGDGVIEYEDAPLEWSSYDIGDIITIRDKITRVSYNPPDSMYYLVYNETTGVDDKIFTGGNNTVISIQYTGNYEINYMGIDPILPKIEINLEGNYTDEYQVGDYITITGSILEPSSRTGENVSGWEINN